MTPSEKRRLTSVRSLAARLGLGWATVIVLATFHSVAAAEVPPPVALRRVIPFGVASSTPISGSHAISPDWTLLAVARDDGAVDLVDMATGESRPALTGGFGVGFFTYFRSDFPPPSSFTFSADGRYLVWTWGKKVVVWELSTHEVIFKTEVQGISDAGVSVSPDGLHLAWAASKRVLLWDVSRGAGETVPGKEVRMFSRNSRWLVVDKATLLEVTTRSRVFADPTAVGIGFSGDSRTLVLLRDRSVGFYDVATGQLRTLPARRYYVSSLFALEGRSFAFVNPKDDIELWDLTADAAAPLILPDRKKGHGESRGSCLGNAWLYLSLDGQTLGDSCRVTDLWDLSGGAPRLLLRVDRPYSEPALSPDGSTLAYPAKGGIGLWDVRARRPLASLIEVGDVGRIEWSPDGSILATTTRSRRKSTRQDFELRLWDATALLGWSGSKP